MINNFTGLREQTPYRMVLDAGALYLDINEAELQASGIVAALTTPWTLEGRTRTPRPLGASQEGAKFNPNKTERQITVNGARTKLKGMSRVDSFEPTLSFNLLEMADTDTFVMSLGQADTSTTASGYKLVEPRVDILEEDYFGNIALITRTSEGGQDKPVVVVIRNPKVVENAEYEFKDPGELAPMVVLQGFSNVLEATTVPCAVYIPVNQDGLGSGS